jgi:tRNA-splicing ligase RtcB (3'-phosphate/5'-hydroxy nucleic acid ligase)
MEKISDVEYRIDPSAKKGMLVPVTIYSNDALIAKMQTDRTIDQAVNVAHLPGVQQHVVVLPDGHEGYGFPIGGVAAMSFDDGVISPGGVGYDINCLPPEAEVLSPLGFRKRIDSLQVGNDVTCFSQKIAKDTKITLKLVKNDGRLVQLRTRAGLKIRATGDHPILTDSGLKESALITPGARVGTHPFVGVKYETPRHSLLLGSSNFAMRVARELVVRNLVPLSIDSDRFPYLVKLLAYFMGDGAFDGKKTWFYGSYEGMEELRKDIKLVGYTPSGVRCRYRLGHIGNKTFDSIEYSVYVSSWSFRRLLEALGAPPGRKTRLQYDLPWWLFETPKWIKRLFLAGYCGAEMNKPQTINGFNFEPPVISMNKTKEAKASGRRFLMGLQKLFEELGIEVCSIREEILNENVRLKLQLSSRPESLIALWSTIGYIYTPHKQRLALAASSWLGWKVNVLSERQRAAAMVVELHGRGSSISSFETKVLSPWVNRRFVERSVYQGRATPPRVPFAFPHFEKWVNGALEGDVVWDEVIDVETQEYSGLVYDITIEDDAHNFAADGFIVSNCGVRLIRTNLNEKDVRPKVRELAREIFRSVPSGLGSVGATNLSTAQLDRVLSDGVKWAVDNGYGVAKDLEFCEENGTMKHNDPAKVSGPAKKRGMNSLGTLGSGNHFVEVQTVNQIFDAEAAKTLGLLQKDQVCVLLHTGSRGLGHQVCSDYLRIVEAGAPNFKISLPDRELACAPGTSREAVDYRLAMGCALNFAWTNRQLITHNVRRAFERVFKMSAADLGMSLVYDVAHNICKVEEHSVDPANPGKKKKVFVHRKGATRAYPKGREEVTLAYRNIGQPVLIPGSMGTASWVLLGKEKSMLASFGSTAHGAGRTMSRGAAIRSYPYEAVKRDLESKGIVLECASKKGVVEEAPGAYKDVDAVADVSDRVGIATKVVRLTPIAVIKG